MILSDMSTRKRHDTLWLALEFVLQDMTHEETTASMADLLQARLGFSPKELPQAMTWLKKVAPLVPEASQTGAVVKAYGRYGRRWVWSPRNSAPQGVREVGPVEKQLNDAGVIDTKDW